MLLLALQAFVGFVVYLDTVAPLVTPFNMIILPLVLMVCSFVMGVGVERFRSR
jgi:hypothetical protein